MTNNTLFSTIITGSKETRQQKQMVQIVRFLSKSEKSRTIPEISKHVKISVPTTMKLIGALIDSGLILDEGKRDTDSGRKPTLYSLNKEQFYSIGVEINLKGIRIGLFRIDFGLSKSWESKGFELENSESSLDQIVKGISNFIKSLSINKSQILGIGVGITGRVNTKTGESFSFFDFLDVPFARYIHEVVDLPVFVDNDSRVLGLAELVIGKAKGVSDALVLNVSRGLGMCIISNGLIISGGLGFAGEFGHMQFGDKKRLCLCGKQNCLGTEVSGYSLEVDLRDAIRLGDESLCIKESNLRYEEILKAAMKGDALCIRLIQQQGEKLGESLGNIINLLNPSFIIIGGEFAASQDIFLDAIKIGIKRSALINALMGCVIENSCLIYNAVMKGSAALVYQNLKLL